MINLCQESSFSLAYQCSLLSSLRIVYTYVAKLKSPVVTEIFDHNNTGRLYGQHAVQLRIDRRAHIVPEVVSR